MDSDDEAPSQVPQSKAVGGVDDGPQTEDISDRLEGDSDKVPKEDEVREINKSSQMYIFQSSSERQSCVLENRRKEVRLKRAFPEMDSDDEERSQVPRSNQFVPGSSKTVGRVDDGPQTEGISDRLEGETDNVPKEDEVREIDVVFNPQIDKSSQMYIFQSSSERQPCVLENRREEVRPKRAFPEMEMAGFSVDHDPNNEDCGNRLKITEQIMATTWIPISTTGSDVLAVGILTGNKLHLNPITAVVRLRLSSGDLESGGLKGNNSATGDAEVTEKAMG